MNNVTSRNPITDTRPVKRRKIDEAEERFNAIIKGSLETFAAKYHHLNGKQCLKPQFHVCYSCQNGALIPYFPGSGLEMKYYLKDDGSMKAAFVSAPGCNSFEEVDSDIQKVVLALTPFLKKAISAIPETSSMNSKFLKHFLKLEVGKTILARCFYPDLEDKAYKIGERVLLANPNNNKVKVAVVKRVRQEGVTFKIKKGTKRDLLPGELHQFVRFRKSSKCHHKKIKYTQFTLNLDNSELTDSQGFD